MTGINHALAGTAVASAIRQPLLALPLAFVSHFVCDMMPHFSFEGGRFSRATNNKIFKSVISLDTALLLSLTVLLLIKGRYSLLLGGLAAFSPDIIWIYGHLKGLSPSDMAKKDAFSRFHKRIQTRERFKYWPLEIVYAVIFGLLIIAWQ